MYKLLKTELDNIGITNSILQEKISLYIELLLSEKKVRNIIGTRDIETVINKHIITSAKLAKQINSSKGVDVGSGNGLPGIVISIINHKKSITLVEPMKSRVNFLNKIVRELTLKNVSIVNTRAEYAGKDIDFREKFSFATCRAVGSLSLTSELVLPLLKIGGSFFAQRGSFLEEELKNSMEFITNLGGKILGKKQENILVIEKVYITPEGYPRTWKKIISS